MLKCQYCHSDWKNQNSLNRHERQCENNPNPWWTEERRRKASEVSKERSKTKEYNKSEVCCLICNRVMSYKQITNHYGSKSCLDTDEGEIKKEKIKCPYCNKSVRNRNLHFDNCRQHPDWKNKSSRPWSEERRKRQSERMKEVVKNNPDSYSKNNVCGRVKSIEYEDGVVLKGSWEVRVAEWLDSQDIRWENESNPQPYYWNDGWRLYFPDFYLPEHNCYIEVKGFRTERDIAKWDYFDGRLLIFEKEVIDDLDSFSIQQAVEKFIW